MSIFFEGCLSGTPSFIVAREVFTKSDSAFPFGGCTLLHDGEQKIKSEFSAMGGLAAFKQALLSGFEVLCVQQLTEQTKSKELVVVNAGICVLSDQKGFQCR